MILLDTVSHTRDLGKLIESSGVSALAIHARRIPERPQHPAHWDELQQIIHSSNLSIPIIGNGDVLSFSDISAFKQKTGCNSVMIGRGALKNISIFRPDSTPLDTILTDYLKKAIKYGACFNNMKYTLQQMMIDQLHFGRGLLLNSAKTSQQLFSIFGIEQFSEESENPS